MLRTPLAKLVTLQSDLLQQGFRVCEIDVKEQRLKPCFFLNSVFEECKICYHLFQQILNSIFCVSIYSKKTISIMYNYGIILQIGYFNWDEILCGRFALIIIYQYMITLLFNLKQSNFPYTVKEFVLCQGQYHKFQLHHWKKLLFLKNTLLQCFRSMQSGVKSSALFNSCSTFPRVIPWWSQKQSVLMTVVASVV